MKTKLISLFILFVLLLTSVFGCSGAQAPASGESADTDPTVAPIAGVGGSLQFKYMTLEDCLDTATNVVLATCEGVVETSDTNRFFAFTVAEQYKGTIVTKKIHVSTFLLSKQAIAFFHPKKSTDPNTFTETSYKDMDYKTGETYLLMLGWAPSVYSPNDIYVPVGSSLYLITDEYSMFRNGESIALHCELSDTATHSQILSYAKRYAKNAPAGESRLPDYIRDTALENVVDNTPIIAIVTPKENVTPNLNAATRPDEIYSCTVGEVLKGTLEDTTVRINFFADTVEVGREYIVMIKKTGTGYIFTYKNSFHDATDENIRQVKELIQAE